MVSPSLPPLLLVLFLLHFSFPASPAHAEQDAPGTVLRTLTVASLYHSSSPPYPYPPSPFSALALDATSGSLYLVNSNRSCFFSLPYPALHLLHPTSLPFLQAAPAFRIAHERISGDVFIASQAFTGAFRFLANGSPRAAYGAGMGYCWGLAVSADAFTLYLGGAAAGGSFVAVIDLLGRTGVRRVGEGQLSSPQALAVGCMDTRLYVLDQYALESGGGVWTQVVVFDAGTGELLGRSAAQPFSGSLDHLPSGLAVDAACHVLYPTGSSLQVLWPNNSVRYSWTAGLTAPADVAWMSDGTLVVLDASEGLVQLAGLNSSWSIPSSTGVAPPVPTPQPSPRGLTAGGIAGIVVGSVIGAALLLPMLYCICITGQCWRRSGRGDGDGGQEREQSPMMVARATLLGDASP